MNKQIFTTDEISQKARPVFNHRCVKRAFLFGSYAVGEPTADSDIDIIVDTNRELDLFDVCGIAEELYQIFRKRVDVYDEREIIAESDLARNITANKVLLYEA